MIAALLVLGLAALAPQAQDAVEPAAAPAAAATMPLEEEPAFRAGLAFYEALELEKAAFRFQAAGRSPSLSSTDRARARAWLGVTLVQLGELDDAGVAFRDAVRADPAVALPTKAPPQAESLLAQERRLANEAPLAAPPLAPLVDDPVPAAPAAPAQPPWLLVGGGALVGVGAGAAIAAAVVGARALVVADAAKTEPFHGAAAALYREAEADALVANVLWVGAGAAVLIGAGVCAAAVLVE